MHVEHYNIKPTSSSIKRQNPPLSCVSLSTTLWKAVISGVILAPGMIILEGRDSSVGAATGYGLNDRDSIHSKDKNFLFSIAFSPPLRPMQPPIQWVSGTTPGNWGSRNGNMRSRQLCIPLLTSICGGKSGCSSAPITIHLSYFPESITEPLTNHFDFMFCWWINCAQLSAIMAVHEVQICMYGSWFDVAVKRASTFTHEDTFPC
jgi:hypothetical protein